MAATVETDYEAGVFTLRLNRPEKLNAMNAELLDDFFAGMVAAAADPEVRVIVVTGNGRGFCSGGDLTSALEARKASATNTVAMAMTSVQVFSLMEWVPKPIIAMVNGPVYAGGLGFVLYSDLAVASDQATFCTPQASRGLFEPYVATRLAARVGVERANYMLMTARVLTAPEAFQWGLVSEVHPHDELDAATRELAQRLAGHDADSLREYKYAVRRTLPGFDLGTFVNETITSKITSIMEDFAEEFPAPRGAGG